MRNILISTTLILGLGFPADAQSRNGATAGAKPVVVEATKQVLRYRNSNLQSTEYRFVIIWQDKAAPVSGFFYRDGKDWKETSVARPERRQFNSNSQDYMMVENGIDPKDAKPGDKLIITSRRHDHDEEEMPAVVTGMAKQGLFYATGSGKSLTWKHIPVTVRTLPERTQ